MPGDDNKDVTLACVDPALVSCWDRMVKQGNECSLLLKHSKGKVTVTMQCTTPAKPLAMSSSTSLSSSAKRKKKKGGKKRKLEKLLAYHQSLVVEKGLPPSRLMKEHAATFSAPSAQSTGTKKFKCEQCDFNSDSQRGLKVHIGRSHKNPEVLRDGKLDQSLDLFFASSKREEISSCHNCGGPFSPLHQCGEVGTGDDGRALDGDQTGKGICTRDCEFPICCNCEPVHASGVCGVCNCEGFVAHH